MGTANISREEIIVHLTSTEWLKELISLYLTQRLKEILKYYYYFSEGYRGPAELLGEVTKTEEYYPQKGILLYTDKMQSAQGGTPFPSWAKRDDVYLLGSGQFATIQFKSCYFLASGSIYDSDLKEEAQTVMRAWMSDEIQENKIKITDSLLELIEDKEAKKND